MFVNIQPLELSWIEVAKDIFIMILTAQQEKDRVNRSSISGKTAEVLYTKIHRVISIK